MLCFKLCIPLFSLPLPSGVQISKQNMHRTFNPINNFTPVRTREVTCGWDRGTVGVKTSRTPRSAGELHNFWASSPLPVTHNLVSQILAHNLCRGRRSTRTLPSDWDGIGKEPEYDCRWWPTGGFPTLPISYLQPF